MANIQDKILSKYEIDIAQENIFKLYKIENADISDSDLQAAFDATRKRWNQSINGANEKNAERDRARLEKADKYEAILKDKKLRKEVFAFYNGETKQSKKQGASVDGIDFAREYFKLLETSKKIKKEDVDFFFDYYPAERKNKKAILEMLTKELKLHGLGKEEQYSEESNDNGPEGKKKDASSPLIMNLFQKATVYKLRKCVEFFTTAAQSNEVSLKYPAVRDSIYNFLDLKNVDDISSFKDKVNEGSKEVYQVRQERGTDFVPLVDMFNTLKEMVEYRDVVDNFEEFKLLLKYPSLTPYMYSFVEMKPNTMKGIINVANREYSFRDDADFILNYYNPVHDNFGISNSAGLSSMLRRAEKKAAANKAVNYVGEKLGLDKKRQVSIGAEIIYGATYFPIFMVYFVFEVFKAIFTELHKFAIPVFALVFGLLNWLLPKALDVDNLLILRLIFSKAKWTEYLSEFWGEPIINGGEMIAGSLMSILILLALYFLPSWFFARFVSEAAEDLNKRYDWIGYERTFQAIFQQIRQKAVADYTANKELFVKKKIPSVIVNVVSLIVVIALVILLPHGAKALSEKTGYFQGDEYEVGSSYNPSDKTGNSVQNDGDAVLMEITASTANIRSGPGKDNDVIATASKGEVFIATGNEEKSGGRTWYEIYVDKGGKTTGWASEKVIKVQK
jgi:hypothetical protein